MVELIWKAEEEGEPAFHDAAFMTTRDRAELAAPYPGDERREHIVDVVELAVCTHRQVHHGEDFVSRIEYLKAKPMTLEEADLATRDWWNQ